MAKYLIKWSSTADSSMGPDRQVEAEEFHDSRDGTFIDFTVGGALPRTVLRVRASYVSTIEELQ